MVHRTCLQMCAKAPHVCIGRHCEDQTGAGAAHHHPRTAIGLQRNLQPYGQCRAEDEVSLCVSQHTNRTNAGDHRVTGSEDASADVITGTPLLLG